MGGVGGVGGWAAAALRRVPRRLLERSRGREFGMLAERLRIVHTTAHAATGSYVAAGLNNNPRSPSSYQRIYAIVRRIPKGRVSTYGRVAELAGLPGHARQVGYAMHALPAGSTVPWHRVVNASGGVSPRGDSSGVVTQRLLLEQEGVRFGPRDRISLRVYGWDERPGGPR